MPIGAAIAIPVHLVANVVTVARAALTIVHRDSKHTIAILTHNHDTLTIQQPDASPAGIRVRLRKDCSLEIFTSLYTED